MSHGQTSAEPAARHSLGEIARLLREQGFEPQLCGRVPGAEEGRTEYLRGAVTDSREAAADLLFVARRGEEQDGHAYIEAAYGQGCRNFLVSQDWLARQGRPSATGSTGAIRSEASFIAVTGSTEEALFAWARFYRLSLSRLFVVALSGSHGKTGTKELLGRMLGRRYRCHITAGNRNAPVGCALTILGIAPETEIAILELGIDHPGEMDLLCSLSSPNAALLTGIGSAHLGGFSSQAELAREKARIYAQLQPGLRHPAEGAESGTAPAPMAFLPAEDRFLAALRREIRPGSREVLYSAELAQEKGYTAEDRGLEGLRFRSGEWHCDVSLLGLHTRQMFWAAATVAENLGLSVPEIFAGARDYRPLFGRGELLLRHLPEAQAEAGEPRPVRLLQDCYNASPESLYALIQMLQAWRQNGLAPPCVLVLADMLELGTFSAECHRKVAELLQTLFCAPLKQEQKQQEEHGQVSPIFVFLYGKEMDSAWHQLQQLQKREAAPSSSGAGEIDPGETDQSSRGLHEIGSREQCAGTGCAYVTDEAELARAVERQLRQVACVAQKGAGRDKGPLSVPLLVLKGARAMYLEKIAQKILL
ncbi:Mur ligase family protein [Candidatus Haliotispira prima]|uniref:Mur ligase family protein n=1 Tax=Candidatus Haliotispira prima TaxID=3034016 RepID=A0ABY8MFH3_9SPIO|nr:Mur ligase family protein [Candidatus Haliotispira prima]